MSNSNYFDTTYVENNQTVKPVMERSEIKSFLKESTSEEEMLRYGSSKPRRVVIKGKIIDGKG
ncbi:conserved hypothetical protein [Bathymodiolus platifrons methanotrophic gill symbiont]|uniref:hypothetical protein n=1 Tax=Bathymodiolus platifrons methanotrophic gill symbiont TaxID=113268 RepID=UPI000B40C316|nr:hypothetical protein [Bathymodiolus platifrons methanotrophic gill symbiont]TXK93261.1 hypothetical protein BMR10_16255 [Methylococcaceae bacterium CS4]TXK94517.1 hypothetical protein BMR11_15090 [Methylococcaceae bacterium CS5]TXL02217.1 hypothetical protein BMR09_17355 [Methylococcaceae bacterium CS3]TXL06233.1 hypothetical protein BMR08_15560 [Methylococcaceae bacterium CS2]TXL08464.1 hypothetical protein BMR07_02480 [Methylococcaceae bacterium CS1]TXL13485.1 hypothetical protein BMR05_